MEEIQLEAQIVDIEIFDKGFTLSGLWTVHQKLSRIKQGMQQALDDAMYDKNTKEAVRITIELHFVSANLDTIEVVMLAKEDDVFVNTNFESYCLN